MDADQIIAELEGAGLLDSSTGWKIERASGGLNTAVWVVADSSSAPGYIVRVGRPGRDLLHEARAASAAVGCLGVPVLRLINPWLLVHDYLPGAPQPLDEADVRQINALAKTLACIHSKRMPGYVLWPDTALHLGARIDALHGRIAALERTDLNDFPELRKAADLLRQHVSTLDQSQAGWRSSTFGLLHGDLSIGNMLWTEDGVNLIDWEYARAGDPAEELAYLITEQPVNQSIVEQLKASYLNAGGEPAAWDRLPPWAAFTALDSAAWWIDYLRAQGEDPTGHVEIKTRTETAMNWLAR